MYRIKFVLFLLLCSFIATAQTKPSKEYLTHLNAAKSHNVGLVKDKTHLNKLVKQGKLVAIKQRGYGYRIDKLTHSHAYLVPKGRTVLNALARDFVKAAGQNFFVVTSLTRTEADQKRLRRVNSNASSNDSSHSFGGAIDISYVRFNHHLGSNSKLEKHLETVLKKYQSQGKIYFVKERQSRCFHIIFR
ncbi:DUF5715 family protein [Flavobacterium sp. CBA20B-1]|uniref:DUF5715 family protein n=1 Tax=Paenimyroides aestuarii TaxID=2968490 RepID=A0ABY5NPG2_9FLAO|nr:MULTISPECIES: DUF5715 family protein [Flavobacteriaceae]UUV20431.1 DUF5715 family protein [Paenimyroides aestuarii]WCM43130.1 DUF5715 family protein [Flavobacterium sp. CBA20B-1]